MRTRSLLFLMVVLLAAFSVPAQTPSQPPANRWAELQFLLGDWVGEGAGEPGQGTGSFSFQTDLQEKILLRRNRADYPASKDRPAYAHNDLMVIYRPAEGKSLRADYFDNEDHIIHYTVTVSADGRSVEFLSDIAEGSPRFRLTYGQTGAGRLAIRFEIAPPGKPEAFSTYIAATARKK